MALFYILIILFSAAFLLEIYIGRFKYKMHPLNLMGGIAVFFEGLSSLNFINFIFGGIISGIVFNFFTVLTITLFFSTLCLLAVIISPLLFYLLSVYILASFISTGGLKYESINIYKLLRTGDIDGARKNLSSLAGRDGYNLDTSEISRAVVESVSENTGDGIGSVIFYFSVGIIAGLLLERYFSIITAGIPVVVFCGVILSVIYKSINLLDSLVGYKNEKYKKFGKFSARLDDVLNYVPFRITAFFMLLTTIILSFTLNKSKTKNIYYAKDALKSFIGFRKSHPSPNGGQLESIMAGALNIKLGGVNFYGGIENRRPVIGFDYYGKAGKENIRDAVKIMELTSVLLIIFYAIIIPICVLSSQPL